MKRFDMATILSVWVLIIVLIMGCSQEQQPRSEADFHKDRGHDYFNKGMYDQAISDYTKAIALNPKDAVTYYNRGNAYGQGKGLYDQAISDYRRAIELKPRAADA